MTTEQMTAHLTTNPAAVIENDRQRYEAQICRTVDIIAANGAQRPVILLAGPSGSGKTTTALLIERELERRGLQTHTLQMDDYFCALTEEEIALLRKNELDLERPTRVDIPFFQEQLGQILSGQEVELPRYDFKTSSRVFEGRTLHRKPGELVIMEGIHALNPQVTGYSDSTTRIYVSVRTRIRSKSGTELHPSKIRLARRLLRDRMGRGRALTEIIAMRERVDAGEKNYIMPYKALAHCSVDTFHACEMSVYRPWLLEELRRLQSEYPELDDLVEVLSELPEVPTQLLPGDSLLREFVGESELKY